MTGPLNLDIIVIPTYNISVLTIADASVYPDSPPIVSSPIIEITPPGFNTVSIPFTVNAYTTYNSYSLGITGTGDPLLPLPDGIYVINYSIYPSTTYFVNKSIMRVDNLQEQFDTAFMKLDMMECDRAIKTQAKVDLNTVYFFIQGAIASANMCAIDESNKLYNQAVRMLSYFIRNNCGCSGNNYTINFQ